MNDFARLEALPDGRGERYYHQDLKRLLDHSERLYFYLLVPRQSAKKERTLAALLKSNGRWHHIRYFNAELRDALLTTARVPSFRDPAQQLRTNQFTWYGKLIRSLYDLKGEEKAQQIQDAQDLLTGIVGEVFQGITERLSQRLGKAIFHNKVEFRPGAFTNDDAYKQVTMFVDDGLEGPYYDKGSGIQSALIIALFAFYCEHFHRGGSLLLAEEPELYLHPQARRAIETQLTEFATAGLEAGPARELTRQVIISTHAVEFLRNAELQNITCVRKPSGQAKTVVRQIGAKSEESTLRRWRQAIRTKNAEMLFADHVILVEGGEEYVLPALADLRFGEKGWLDAYNISVVRADGKMQFRAYVEILDQLDIGHTILTDLDFIREGLDSRICPFDESTSAKLAALRSRIDQVQSSPRGRDIKKAFSPENRDWQRLYRQIDGAIEDLLQGGDSLGKDRIAEIRELWEGLQDRLTQPDLGSIVQTSGGIDDLLSAARQNGVCILSLGDLEDYLTKDAESLPGGSKDRKALAVAEKLGECRNLSEAERWIHCAELVSALELAARKIGIPVALEDEIPF